MKKIVLIILSCLLCAGCIAGIIYAAARKPGKNETVSSGDNSEIKISAEIPISDSKTESTKTEIEDNGKGLKPDETEADKILQKAEQKKEVYNEPVLQGNEQKTKKYVRDADPETGIS